MTMRIKNNHHCLQQGFVFLPVIIALSVLIVLGGSGAVVYQVQKSNKAENEELRQEINELREREEIPSPTPTDSQEGQDEQEKETSPTILSPSPELEFDTKETTTTDTITNRAVTSPTSSELNIPLIIELEFEKAYGRKPSNSESTIWKSKYRANSWSRSQLYDALIASKPSPSTKPTQAATVPTQANVQPAANSTTTNPANSKARIDSLTKVSTLMSIYDSFYYSLQEEAKLVKSLSVVLRSQPSSKLVDNQIILANKLDITLNTLLDHVLEQVNYYKNTYKVIENSNGSSIDQSLLNKLDADIQAARQDKINTLQQIKGDIEYLRVY